jgi:hypothetical protein
MGKMPGSAEDRCKIIECINQQDVFRTQLLFDITGINKAGNLRNRVYKLLQALKADQYIVGLERDQYALIKPIPDNYTP